MTDDRTLSQMNDDDKRIPASNQGDLPDSKHDAERLKPDETVLDLPDVSDIPGQEHVTVLPMGELSDTTISSEDEEGASVLGE